MAFFTTCPKCGGELNHPGECERESMTNQPTASGVSEEMLDIGEAALRNLYIAVVAEGSTPTLRAEAMVVLEAALSAKPAQGEEPKTLRDWFAGMALAEVPDPSSIADAPTTAKLAYAIADAMLIEREAKPAQGGDVCVVCGMDHPDKIVRNAAKPPQPIPTPDEALREKAKEIAGRNPLICSLCTAMLPNPECGHRLNGLNPCCVPSTESLEDDIFEALAAMSRVAALSRATPDEAKMDYVSTRVFEGKRPISPEHAQRLNEAYKAALSRARPTEAREAALPRDPEGNHLQRTILTKVKVDDAVADLVLYLNTIPGVYTHASCQGTLGEGGDHPYRPQVMVAWSTDHAFKRLAGEFDLSELHEAWCYVHPKDNDLTRFRGRARPEEAIRDAALAEAISLSERFSGHHLTKRLIALKSAHSPAPRVERK